MNKKQKKVLAACCLCAVTASACWHFTRPRAVVSDIEVPDYHLSEDEKSYLLESALNSMKEYEAAADSDTQEPPADSEEAASSEEAADEKDTASSAASGNAASGSTPRKEEAAASSRPEGQHEQSSSASRSDSTKPDGASSTADASLSHGAQTVQAQVDARIKRLYELQDQFENRLMGIIREAYSEYMAYPKDQRSSVLKIKIITGKLGDISALEKECDAEVAQVTGELTAILKANNMDTSIVKEVEKTYRNKKSALKKELLEQAYSGGDGSGTSGHWLDRKGQ